MRAVIALAAVWLAAGAVIATARSTKPTPQTVFEFLRTYETRDRREFVARLAGQMNRLTFAERQQVKASDDYLRIFVGLSPGEKERYLAATLEIDLRQTLEAIEKMPGDRRRVFLAEVAEQADNNNANLHQDPAVKERVRRLAEATLEDFFEGNRSDAREELTKDVERLRMYLHIW